MSSAVPLSAEGGAHHKPCAKPDNAPLMVHWCRYVPHRDPARIARMLSSGWEIKAMRSSHGYWSVLMVWPSVYPPPEEE